MEFEHSLTLSALCNKRILITGTTGFVGKVVLEKLLRSVPTIGKIHLLIRGNGAFVDARQRFENEVASSSIFDTLKGEHPECFEQLCDEKLRFVTGELTEAQFGLSDTEFMRLARDVDLIINSAASVDFREPLDRALQTNALSLQSIIRMARVNAIPVIQVSTCYVNGYHSGVMRESIVAPAHGGILQSAAGYFEVDALIENLQREAARVSAQCDNKKQREQALITLGLEQAQRFGWNDTYTFTKWLGEQLLLKQLQGQALTIVRPAIVESTLQEPVPGWIEGVKVADAIILAYAREKVTFFPGKQAGIIDIIPADLVANSIILASAEALCATPAHRIYQCSSSHCNPIRIRDVVQHVQDEAMQHFARYENLFYRRPKRPFIMVPNRMFTIGIGLVYGVLQLRNRLLTRIGVPVAAAKLANLDTTIKLALVFSFYTQPRYTFSNEQLDGLSARMTEYDRAQFPVDARRIDWPLYIRKIHLAGLNRFSLMPKVPVVMRRQKRRQAEAA